MYEYKGLRVWRLNDYDWVCAEWFEDAVEWYVKEHGIEYDEAVEESYADEMVDLNSTMRIEDDENERITFREVIEKEYKNKTEPWVIASSEF